MKDSRLYIILPLLIFASCGQQEIKQVDDSGQGFEYRIIEIDGCEYITTEYSFKYANNYSFSITHKGNCKNHPK